MRGELFGLDMKGEHMRRSFLVALVTAFFAMAIPAAWADSASFHYANASVDSDGALSVSFKLTGLGTGVSSVEINLTAAASATYQCWNNGGKHPKAGNKEDVNGPLDVPATFAVKHGQVTDTITGGPLGPGDFSCPSGQSLFLEAVGYSNIGLQTAGSGSGFASIAATPSSISLTNLHIAV
jgi:hypothetical protein